MSKGGHFLAQQPKKKTKTWVVVVAVILAVILLIARNVLEHKGKGEKGDVR